MSILDQYTDTIRQSQETWTTMVQSLTDNVTKAFGTAGDPFTQVDPNAAIDQVFDFWTKTLDMQRVAAKQLVGATVSAGDKIRSQAESFTTEGHDKV